MNFWHFTVVLAELRLVRNQSVLPLIETLLLHFIKVFFFYYSLAKTNKDGKIEACNAIQKVEVKTNRLG